MENTKKGFVTISMAEAQNGMVDEEDRKILLEKAHEKVFPAAAWTAGFAWGTSLAIAGFIKSANTIINKGPIPNSALLGILGTMVAFMTVMPAIVSVVCARDAFKDYAEVNAGRIRDYIRRHDTALSGWPMPNFPGIKMRTVELGRKIIRIDR